MGGAIQLLHVAAVGRHLQAQKEHELVRDPQGSPINVLPTVRKISTLAVRDIAEAVFEPNRASQAREARLTAISHFSPRAVKMADD